MPIFNHDGINFNYRDIGERMPFVFQHGLGGDLNQPSELYKPQDSIRFVTFDFRAHGDTRPLGNVDKLRFADFADDLLRLIDHLGLHQIVVGGISMGAGVALNFAISHPNRIRGLVLSRPAWLDSPRPANLLVMVRIAGMIRQFGAQEGLERFRQSDEYREFLEKAPDVADSLLRQFTQPRAEETVAKLECLPSDAPTYDRAGWTMIKAPTVVFVTRSDPIHPHKYGTILAQTIPGAELVELTAKSISKERYTLETQQYIGEFLQRLLH